MNTSHTADNLNIVQLMFGQYSVIVQLSVLIKQKNKKVISIQDSVCVHNGKANRWNLSAITKLLSVYCSESPT